MSPKYDNPHEELLERMERPLGMSPSQVLQLFRVRTKENTDAKQEYASSRTKPQYDAFSSTKGR